MNMKTNKGGAKPSIKSVDLTNDLELNDESFTNGSIISDLDLNSNSGFELNEQEPVDGALMGQPETPEERAARMQMEKLAQQRQQAQKQYLQTFTDDMEHEFTRSGKYRPLAIVMHKGKKEHAIILRQHSERAYTYILISDFDTTDRKYLGRFINASMSRRRQVHEMMRDVSLRNGNNALEYFLHFQKSVGYAGALDSVRAMQGAR